MDAVEQRQRVFRLVRLKLADEVEPQVGVRLAQGGPLGLRFLHAVLTEHALALCDQGRDGLGRVSLGNGDEFDRRGLAAGDMRGLRDAGANVFERRCWLIHGALL